MKSNKARQLFLGMIVLMSVPLMLVSGCTEAERQRACQIFNCDTLFFLDDLLAAFDTGDVEEHDPAGGDDHADDDDDATADDHAH